MKLVSATVIILVLIAVVSTCGCTNASADGDSAESKIFISGAFALYPMMIKWSEEYQKIHPEIKFEISGGGAGKGMTDALSGMVDIGMVSREIYPEEQSQGACWVAVTKDAVVGTINSNNPVAETILSCGVTKSDLEKIFVNNSVTNWGQLDGMEGVDVRINQYSRADACGAASIWAKYIGDYHQENIGGIAVSGDPGLAEAVRADTFGIGFNNINYAYDPTTELPIEGLLILPLDLNENGKIDSNESFYSTRAEIMEAIAKGIYPSPPSRDLNLVTKNEFTGPTKDFVEWILTEGQQYVTENGYIPLPEEVLTSELNTVMESGI